MRDFRCNWRFSAVFLALLSQFCFNRFETRRTDSSHIDVPACQISKLNAWCLWRYRISNTKPISPLSTTLAHSILVFDISSAPSNEILWADLQYDVRHQSDWTHTWWAITLRSDGLPRTLNRPYLLIKVSLRCQTWWNHSWHPVQHFHQKKCEGRSPQIYAADRVKLQVSSPGRRFIETNGIWKLKPLKIDPTQNHA